jgi:CheY-like chemotaxis protein
VKSRILVADNDLVVVQLVAATLRGKGYEVIPVFDAMQAVTFAPKTPPPRRDRPRHQDAGGAGMGLETIKRLKSPRKTALIPIVILSGSTDPDMPDKVRVAGAVAFLGKPVDPVALCDTLETVLGKL